MSPIPEAHDVPDVPLDWLAVLLERHLIYYEVIRSNCFSSRSLFDLSNFPLIPPHPCVGRSTCLSISPSFCRCLGGKCARRKYTFDIIQMKIVTTEGKNRVTHKKLFWKTFWHIPRLLIVLVFKTPFLITRFYLSGSWSYSPPDSWPSHPFIIIHDIFHRW